jgi:glycine/D-amino acid oxidase-like deaminating enzyme
MDSLWQVEHAAIPGDAFPHGHHFDVAIVGAGIAGLTAALLFARAGKLVVVLEAREIGAVTTGHSTAKVSQLQGTMLQRIRSRNTAGVLGAYVESQRAAFDWLMRFTEEEGVDVERRPAFTYASTPDGRSAVEAEARLAGSHGLPVEVVDRVDLPFETFGAVRLDDQAQLDPMELLAALTREVRGLGGRVVTGARVTGVRASAPAARRAGGAGDRVAHPGPRPLLRQTRGEAKLRAGVGGRRGAARWDVPRGRDSDAERANGDAI